MSEKMVVCTPVEQHIDAEGEFVHISIQVTVVRPQHVNESMLPAFAAKFARDLKSVYDKSLEPASPKMQVGWTTNE